MPDGLQRLHWNFSVTNGHTQEHAHESNPHAPVSFRPGRAYKVRGLDCAEEVAALKQAVGPLVGGADRLAFDVLNGRMMIFLNAVDGIVICYVTGTGI
jgi:Cd2+/Zn2+-exporting ATPase